MLYLSGVGLQGIADYLNEQQIPHRYKTKVWHHNSVRYILTNERYIGKALLQKKYTTDTLLFRQKLNKGEKLQYLVEESNPVIVEKEIFDGVQALLSSREKTDGRQSNPLRGKLRCPECGSTYRRQPLHGKVFWWCGKTSSGNAACKSRRLREDFVFDAFVNMAYKLQAYRKELLENLINELMQIRNVQRQNSLQLQQLDKEIADITAKQIILTKLTGKAVLEESEYAKQLAEIKDNVSALRREKKKLLADNERDSLIEDLEFLNEQIATVDLNGEFNADLFEHIVEKIIVNDSTELTFCLLGGLHLTESIQGEKCE